MLLLQNTNVFEVAVILGIIQAVSNHEFVRDLESDVIDVYGALSPLWLVQQCRDAKRLGLALAEHLHQITKCDAAIDDVLYYDHVESLHGDVDVFCEFDFARRRLAPSVTGDADKFDSHRSVGDGSCQVGQEDERALQNRDKIHRAAGTITCNLRADFVNSSANLIGGDQRANRGHGLWRTLQRAAAAFVPLWVFNRSQ